MSKKPPITPYQLGHCLRCKEWVLLHKVTIGCTTYARCKCCCEKLIDEKGI